MHPGFVAPCLYSYTLATAVLSKPVLCAVLQPQGHLATSILPDVLSLDTEWLHPARVFVVSAPCRILKKACRLVRSALVVLDQNCAKDSYNDLIMLQMMVWRCYGASSWALVNLLVLTWLYPLTQGQTCYHCLVRSVLWDVTPLKRFTCCTPKTCGLGLMCFMYLTKRLNAAIEKVLSLCGSCWGFLCVNPEMEMRSDLKICGEK